MFLFDHKDQPKNPNKYPQVENDQYQREIFSFFNNPDVDEVLVNGVSSLLLIQRGETKEGKSPFPDRMELTRWLQEFAFEQNVRLDPLCPANGGSFKGGDFRWHCFLPPAVPDGPIFSLRRHRFFSLSLGDFSASPKQIEKLREISQKGEIIIFSGPTGSGKTTLMTLVLGEVAKKERVFVVEVVSEIPIISKHWIRMVGCQPTVDGVGEITLSRLIREALRLRPDRMVLGEIRGEEARAFFEMILSGHKGAMTTIHAESPRQAIERFQSLLGVEYFFREQSFKTLTRSMIINVVQMQRGYPPKIEEIASFREGEYEKIG